MTSDQDAREDQHAKIGHSDVWVTMGDSDDRAARVLEALDDHGCGLRVSFAWQRDRFEHRVEVVRDGRTHCWLESIEGGDEQHWPCSPPLQQMSIEPRGQGHTVALMVGMAGDTHWSASVEALSGSPGAAGAPAQVDVDIACRVKQPAEFLGTHYRCSPGTLDVVTADDAQFLVDGKSYRLVALNAAPEPSLSLRLNDTGLCLAAPRPARLPATVRWKYRFCIA